MEDTYTPRAAATSDSLALVRLASNVVCVYTELIVVFLFTPLQQNLAEHKVCSSSPMNTHTVTDLAELEH